MDADREAAQLRLELAQVYLDKEAYTAAVPLLERATTEHPAATPLRVAYATALRETRRYPQAERQYQLAIAGAPDDAAAQAGLGILYDLMRRPAEAERAHRRAVELAPEAGEYWNNLCFSRFAAGDDPGAIAACERAVDLDPGLLVAHNNLGFALGRRGDYQRALRAFRAAGDEAAAQLNLAIAYQRNGDAATARQLRAEAYRLDPRLEDPR
jgi:Flp pilus assembly protein TadD